MDINFDTDRLIVMNYPGGAGGKFISLALGLHPDILIQEKTMARLQMREGASPRIGFDLAMKTFEKKRDSNKHFEFGCLQLANFNQYDLQDDATADERLCNDLWRELTNQNRFYFFMVDDTDLNTYSKYVNRKTIRLINYEWIMKGREIPPCGYNFEQDIDGDLIAFDMESIKENSAFIDEIYKIFNFLGLEDPIKTFDYSIQLDTLRTSFLDTYKTGFIKEKM